MSPRGTCSPTERVRRASATSWPAGTSPSLACLPISPVSPVATGVKVPARATTLAIDAFERIGLPLAVAPDEVRSAMQWWTYRNTKARRMLGFEPRPHEETLEDAVRWQMDMLGDRVRTDRGPQEAALAVVAPLLRATDRILSL